MVGSRADVGGGSFIHRAGKPLTSLCGCCWLTVLGLARLLLVGRVVHGSSRDPQVGPEGLQISGVE